MYIIGGGVAGLLTAQALLIDPLDGASGDRHPDLQVVIVERAEQLGMGLTQGNGRSLTATEGLVAAGIPPAALEQALVTPLQKGGYAYPGFVPNGADRAEMDQYAAGLRAIAPEINNRDLSLVRFGLANLKLWRRWAERYPALATASGFYLNEKLRIYGGSRAQERAIAEVNRLNQAGIDCDWPHQPGRLATHADALAFDPAMGPYFSCPSTSQQALTLQPGGAVHGGRLVEQLANKLLATGQVAVCTQTQVREILWRSPNPTSPQQRSITGLQVERAGQLEPLGTADDCYVFATGFDEVLYQSGAIAAPLFPVAGTSITLPLPKNSGSNTPQFPQRAWKQDVLGPLVFSPTFDPTLDQWILRIGGFKFYPGGAAHPPLDLGHPGVKWAVQQQIQQAIAFLPDAMGQILGNDTLVALVAPNTSKPLKNTDVMDVMDWDCLCDRVNPWVGVRPLYADGMAALGPFARNGYAISGTGSWGLSSGIGNAALIQQWLRGRSTSDLTLPGIPTPWLQDYLQRTDPLRF